MIAVTYMYPPAHYNYRFRKRCEQHAFPYHQYGPNVGDYPQHNHGTGVNVENLPPQMDDNRKHQQ